MQSKRQRFPFILPLLALAISLSLAASAQAQTLTTLATFNGADGSGPFASVARATDGNIYGTTSIAPNSQGSYGGTIFSMSPEGELKTLHTFCSRVNSQQQSAICRDQIEKSAQVLRCRAAAVLGGGAL